MKRQYFAISLIGINSICSQVILIRELIAIFSGNELTMGFVLAAWFLWVAVGSTLGGKWKDRCTDSVHRRFLVLQGIFPFALIIQVILIRGARPIFDLPLMAVVGLGQIFLVSFILLAPLCLINGIMFSLGYQWLSMPYTSPAGRVGLVYVLEAIGAGIGGCIFSFLLIRILSHMQICILLGIVNLLSVFLIYWRQYAASRCNTKGVWISGILLTLFTIIFLASPFLKLDMIIYAYQWRGFDLIDCRDSIYGRVALTHLHGEYSFYEHGVLTGTIPDLWSDEWRVHLPLLQHPSPESILLIGTGLGSIKEALKYKVLSLIDYIELDPTALTLAEQYCPKEYRVVLKTPKVNPVYGDARIFLRNTTKRYDVIILGLPDPQTAQINRMYTQEFFKLAHAHLTEGGILALSATSSENYIGPQLAKFLGCIYQTLKGVFTNILITPGDTAYFIAGEGNGFMTLDANTLSERLRSNNIGTVYFSKYYLPAMLTDERIEFTKNVIEGVQHVELNTDLKPVCYLYDLILWGRYFSPVTGKILEFVKGINKKMLLALTLIALLIGMSTRLLGKMKSRRIIIGLIVLLGGFIEIVLEFLLVLCFQIFYGYAYLQLGILITGFMVGLTIGSALMTHTMDKLKDAYKTLMLIQCIYLLYPALLIIVFKGFNIFTWHSHLVEAYFILFATIAGFIGGIQFPIATKLFLSKTQKWKGDAGLLYGLDLVGSGAGALLSSSLLVPLLGIEFTLAILSIMGLIGVLLLAVNL